MTLILCDGRWARSLKAAFEAEAKAAKELDGDARKIVTLNDTKLDLASVEGKASLSNTTDGLPGQLTGAKKVRQQTTCSLLLLLCMRTRIARDISGPWVVSPSQCDDREMLLVLHAATAAAQLKVVVCHVTVLRHPRPPSIPLLCFVCLVSFIDTACVESHSSLPCIAIVVVDALRLSRDPLLHSMYGGRDVIMTLGLLFEGEVRGQGA